ncbi:LapA family protein [Alkalibacillus silvisoli]|uniref:DUF1049 domain-containing protein n=1 Tax=Alkalibacillus silvisoli TaxID=392823 RepID=A0ABP3JMZ3_9BACI
MKQQTWIILTIAFTIIIAVFAVINVDSVPVDFLIIETEAPLILVILLSVLLGALLVAGVSFSKFYQLQREIRQLKSELDPLSQEAIDSSETDVSTEEQPVEKNDHQP